MEFLSEYGLFFAETATLAIAILLVFGGIIALAGKGKGKDKEAITIKKLNDHYEDMADTLHQEILTKKQLRAMHKAEKKAQKEQKSELKRKRIFVIRFKGDIRASAVHQLRNEITAILCVANQKDEVLIDLESGGGLVHTYGLAASQLQRIRQKNIPLTITVDKVAASGGYMMACVGNKILAAPFAIVGSIGVLAQVPNFNRLLKKNHIDYEQLSAGEYKRTLTVFGENTDKARKKFKEEIEDTHELFKMFITDNRPQIDIDKVATGEHWLATRAIGMDLVDKLITSDDYLLEKSKKADIYQVSYKKKKSLPEKLASTANFITEEFWHTLQEKNNETLI